MKSKYYLSVFFNLFFPLLFVPAWAYYNHSWILLAGVIMSYIGTLCLFSDFGAVVLVALIVTIVYVGAFQTLTPDDGFIIGFLCMVYGYGTAAITRMIKEELIKLKERSGYSYN
jgi:hypothetical protein